MAQIQYCEEVKEHKYNHVYNSSRQLRRGEDVGRLLVMRKRKQIRRELCIHVKVLERDLYSHHMHDWHLCRRAEEAKKTKRHKNE